MANPQPTWRLASHQYDVCFEEWDNAGDNYADWMGEDKWTDLLMPGVWVEGVNPCVTEYDYTLPIDENGELSTPCVYGAQWILPSSDEWDYLMDKRPDAAQKRTGAMVNGVPGWLILPDEWTAPDGFSFVTDYEVEDMEDIPNRYTADEWTAIEKAGAVFLPSAGQLFTEMNTGPAFTSYQLRNASGKYMAAFFFFPIAGTQEAYSSYSTTSKFGGPVRLVQLQSGNTTIKVE